MASPALAAAAFDGMTAAFDLVAQWLRDGWTANPAELEKYADAQRVAAARIRESQ
jgi:hypothetical protein